MSDISVQIQNLEADVVSYQNRMLVERDIADYWYNRCCELEKKLNDALNNRPEGKAGQ